MFPISITNLPFSKCLGPYNDIEEDYAITLVAFRHLSYYRTIQNECPKEILKNIFVLLHFKHFQEVRLVCETWRDLIDTDEDLFTHTTQNLHGIPVFSDKNLRLCQKYTILNTYLWVAELFFKASSDSAYLRAKSTITDKLKKTVIPYYHGGTLPQDYICGILFFTPKKDKEEPSFFTFQWTENNKSRNREILDQSFENFEEMYEHMLCLKTHFHFLLPTKTSKLKA